MNSTSVTTLFEASYPTGSIGKVIKLYISLLKKRTNLDIYVPRFVHISDLTKGLQGQRFFTSGKKCFRFNWKNNKIMSISVWTKVGPTSSPNKTIDVSDLNSNQIIATLAAVLTGSDSKKESIGANVELKIEEESYRKFHEMLGGIFEEEKVHPQQIAFNKFKKSSEFKEGNFKNKKEIVDAWVAWAEKEGIKNPVKTIVYKQKEDIDSSVVSKGARGIRPQESEGSEDPEKAKKKAGFLSEIGMKEGQGNIDAASIFKKIKIYTDLIIGGSATTTSLIISGDPGLGKTTYVEKRLKELGGEATYDPATGKSGGGKWKQFSGSMSTISLYENLYKYNGKILLLDDLKGPFEDSKAVEILKSALDSKEERRVSYEVDSPDLSDPEKITKMEQEIKQLEGRIDTIEKSDKPNENTIERLNSRIQSLKEKIKQENRKPPKQFTYTGRIIFITNRQLNELPEPIVAGRSKIINLRLTGEQSIDYVRDKIKEIAPNVPLKQKESLLNFLIRMVEGGAYKGKLNLRIFNNALEIWAFNNNDVSEQEKKQWIYKDIVDAGENRK
jgi:hypothetical protein